ncbi:MFS transporter [Phytohabitans sp. LJ34]|uniref:MFS transporter n=1 Tax=Phytohabitans sp. LJ34 TaxID=3452217 RepID=UPI003F8A6864
MTTGQLLRHRRFVRLVAARTISVFGNGLGPLALTFAVLGLPDGSPTALSLVLAALAIPRLALLLLGGVVGDRWPRYRVLVAAELAGGAAYAAMAVLLLGGWASVPALAVCAVFAGAASALLLPSLTGVVAEVVPEPDRQSANALLRLGTNSAMIAGFLVGGVLIVRLGAGWALVVDAATFVLAAVLLVALRLPVAARTARRDLLGDLRHGWREFASRQWLWTVVVAAAFINAAVGVTFGLAGPLLAQTRLGGAAVWSWVLAGYAAGTLGGVLIAMRVRPAHPLRTAVLAATALGLPALLLGTGAPMPFVVAASVLAGVAFDVFGVLWETTFQREVPPAALSRVSAYEWIGAIGLGPVALLAAGPIVATTGAATLLVGLSGLIAVAGLAALLSPQVWRYRPKELT